MDPQEITAISTEKIKQPYIMKLKSNICDNQRKTKKNEMNNEGW